VMAPPGVPADRVKELRDALDATVADPAFLADIEIRKLHLDPVHGEEMTKALERAFSFPPAIIAAAKDMMGAH
jgi:tripartite-type tricarboxylate transporter receptor subunit TctC